MFGLRTKYVGAGALSEHGTDCGLGKTLLFRSLTVLESGLEFLMPCLRAKRVGAGAVLEQRPLESAKP